MTKLLADSGYGRLFSRCFVCNIDRIFPDNAELVDHDADFHGNVAKVVESLLQLFSIISGKSHCTG